MFWTLRKNHVKNLSLQDLLSEGRNVEKLIKSSTTDPENIYKVGKMGTKVPPLQWPVYQGELLSRELQCRGHLIYIYIWHLFRFWHILSSYYNTLYILLFSAGTSYGIHIFMYAVKCILTCVRYPIYISIPCISLLSYSSYLSTLCSNIKVFTCHNI